MKTLIVSFVVPQWFQNLTQEAQDKYLEDHHNSKLAKNFHKAKESSEGKEENKKSLTVNDKKNAQDILEKKGSPSDFRGPDAVDQSISGKPRLERRIVSRIDKLAKDAKAAIDAGKPVPDYDLCKISIPGTNLFCGKNKGIPRKEMPQLKGKPVAGSWADKNLPKNKDGEVDSEDAFKKMLADKGHKIKKEKVDVAPIKATQSQMVGAKIAGMFQALKKNPKNPGITAPIYISKDGYVLDGHHRWAALVMLDMADGLKDPITMEVERVDIGIEELVKLTNNFADEIGIAQKAGKAKEHSSIDSDIDLEGYTGCCGKETSGYKLVRASTYKK